MNENVGKLLKKKVKSLTFEECKLLFNYVSKAENYLKTAKFVDEITYFKLKKLCNELTDSAIDSTIYECAVYEESKLIRHVIENIDISKEVSNFEIALENLKGVKIKFWREFLKNGANVDSKLYFLYLIFFTCIMTRNTNEIDIASLESEEAIEDFVLNNSLTILLDNNFDKLNTKHKITINKKINNKMLELINKNNSINEKINKIEGELNEYK